MRLKIAIRLVTISVLFGLIGVGVLMVLPNQYTAKGLLIITRRADAPSKEVFTYEGYYAQQNAGAYTGTFLSILISPDNLNSANIGIDPIKLVRLVKAKREGTQAITLSTKGQTSQDALTIWEKVTQSAIQTHTKLMGSADPLLEVAKIPSSPVILRTYPEWTTVFGVSSAFAFIVVASILVIARYLEETRDN